MDYDKIAGSYNKLYKEEQLNKLKVISNYIKLKRNDKLLDIGCGTTISTNFFKCKTIGIDKSLSMLKKGKGNRIVGKAEELSFKEKSFDAILCITSIHNFDKPEKALNEIKRVKKPNAKVVITLMKKSKNYNKIKNLIKKYFKVIEIEESKDMIFIS